MLTQWPVLREMGMWAEYDRDYGMAWVTPDYGPEEFLIRDVPQDPMSRFMPFEFDFWVVDNTGQLLAGDPREGMSLVPLLRYLLDLNNEGKLDVDIRIVRRSMAEWGYFRLDILSNVDHRLNEYFDRAPTGPIRYS